MWYICTNIKCNLCIQIYCFYEKQLEKYITISYTFVYLTTLFSYVNKTMKFNEDSRIKIPTILHLISLGYKYLSLKNQVWDESTNIFKTQIQKINLDLNTIEVDRLYTEVSLSLENEDLGRAFFKKLITRSGVL